LKYLIPANVASRFQFFAGFGFKELIYVLIVISIFGGFSLLLGFITEQEFVDYDHLSLQEQMKIEEQSLLVNDEGSTYFIKKSVPMIARVIIVVFPAALAFFIVRKDPNTSQSFIDVLVMFFKFSKSQKKLLYFKNIGG